MALEPQIKEIEIKTNKKLESVKTTVQVQLNTNGEKIDKVLFAKSLANIEKVVVSHNNIQIDGIVNSYSLVRVDGGEIVELRKQTNFSCNQVCANVEDGAKVLVIPNVLGAENLNAQEITLSFSQEICLAIFVCEKQKIQYVEEINHANQKIGTIKYQNINGFSTENFEITTEIDLPSSISKILTCECETNIKDSVCSKDILTVNGDVQTNLIYLTNDDVPKVKNQTYSSEFHQEILLNGVDEQDVATVMLNTAESNYDVDGEMSGKGVLEIKNKINACVVTRRPYEIKCMFDAFCPRKELNMEYSSFQTENVVLNKNFNDKVDGNFVLDGDNQIDRIIFCTKGEAKVLGVQKSQDDIVVKGEVGVFVVYALDDEQNTLQSVNIMVPFECKCGCDVDVCADKIFASVKIKDIDARNKRAKEIDVLTELNICVIALNKCDEVVVCGISVGEDRKQDLCSMGIYVIDKATDCWEVAKKLLVNPDVLMSQNKDLTFPIEKPTQIIVYRQRVINN